MSDGGIAYPDQVIDHERYSQDEGELVALGSQAYKNLGDGTPWCKVGDTVFLNRHSGVFKTDEETGEVYRLVNDQDIMGVVRS